MPTLTGSVRALTAACALTAALVVNAGPTASTQVASAATAGAAPAPTASIPAEIVSILIEAPSYGSMANHILNCDDSHPYLVLDAAADNSSRWFRSATYHTGDGKPLDILEHIIPGNRQDENDDEGKDFGSNFTRASIWVRITDTSFQKGHASVTVYCASTLEAAHQNLT